MHRAVVGAATPNYVPEDASEDLLQTIDQSNEARTTSWNHTFTTFLLPLCFFGFFRAFKPSEPFAFRYFRLVKGLSDVAINNEIYPYWTYGYFCFLPFAGLFTKVVGYKRMIAFEAVAQSIAFLLFIEGQDVTTMKIANTFYGIETASQTSFFSYVFCTLNVDQQQRASSYVNAAVLLGYFVGGLVGQLVYSWRAGTDGLLPLYYISLSMTLMALATAYFIPSDKLVRPTNYRLNRSPLEAAFWRKILHDLSAMFTSWIAICWSVWYALAYVGLSSNESYISSLFFSIDESLDYNGIMSALASLLSAFTTILPNCWPQMTSHNAHIIVAIGTALCAIFTILLAKAKSIWSAYASFLAFECVIYFLNSIASVRIALQMESDAYVLVFLVNTMMSLSLQSVLQMTMSVSHLDIDISERYFIYGILFCILSGFSLAVLLGAHITKSIRSSYDRLRAYEASASSIETTPIAVRGFQRTPSWFTVGGHPSSLPD